MCRYAFLLCLLLCCSTATVLARPYTTTARQLQQVNQRCAPGCAAGRCELDSTTGGYRCTKCLPSLVLHYLNGTCGCPAGRYAGIDACVDCDKGSYCIGGTYTGSGEPHQVSCTTHSNDLTTLGKRSINRRACVNLPGTCYVLDDNGDPSTAGCPVNTYGPGLKKQRACVPCPPGYTTDGLDRRTSVTACVVAPGFYLKGPGQVAPCPRGEYKSGTSSAVSCTKCAPGVTTLTEASTTALACIVVMPTFYASRIINRIILETQPCPQKHYCPGGVPTAAFDPWFMGRLEGTFVIPCANGTWTADIGAWSAEQCMTPPGYKTTQGATIPCSNGEYRPDWMPSIAASACKSCGVGIETMHNEEFTVFDPVDPSMTTALPASTSSGACFIRPGQGMYYSSTTDTYRAVNCDSDNYGVADVTMGLAVYPCRSCPSGMQTSVLLPNSAAYYSNSSEGGSGFTDPLACVTKAGHGYNGRVATKCQVGSFNAAGNYGTCEQCDVGLTTLDNAERQADVNDCVLAVGFGLHDNVVMPCPLGYYNSVVRPNRTAPCDQCPTGLTTASSGGRSSDDCNLCAPGYGGENCATLCGGDAATFGVAGRPKHAPCAPCPSVITGYSFDYLANNLIFAPDLVARSGADTASHCLAEFAQIMDVAWFVGGNATMTMASDATSFAACVAKCKSNPACQYITYDYDASICWVKQHEPGLRGEVLAFKAVIAADTPANSRAASGSLASGSFTFWRDAGTGVGATRTPASTANYPACLAECDARADCAAVQMTGVTDSASAAISSCFVIRGDNTAGTFNRSVTKAGVSRFRISSGLDLS